MCIELDKLIELAKAMGTTDREAVNRIIEAQDRLLQTQKEKAESSRGNAKPVRPHPLDVKPLRVKLPA